MAKIDKLINRFKSRPKDFTWDELISLLNKLDFKEVQGSGSRAKFYHPVRDCLIQLRKSHPAKILKCYMLREVLQILTKEKLI